MFRGIQMSLFPVAIVTLFIRDYLDMTMFEVYILQGAFAVFTAVLEFPGGYIADRMGYRLSLFLASLLAVVGWSIYSGAVGFYTILASEFILALSLALTSGTDSALMYESLLELDDEPAFSVWYSRARSTGAFSEGTAALSAGWLFATWERLPFLVATGVWVINVVIALLLVEAKRDQPEELHPWRQAKRLIHYTFVKMKELRACTVVIVVLGMSSFVPVWIIAAYAKDGGMPEKWIGVMWAGANYCVALGHLTSTRLLARVGLMGSLTTCILLITAGYAGLGASQVVMSFLFYYLICYGRGINGPMLNHEQQRLIPSSDRAALLSVTSLTFRSLFAILAPILGYAFDHYSDHDVLLVTGGVFLPVSLACLMWYRKTRSASGAMV